LHAPVPDAQVDSSGLAVLAGLPCDSAIGEDVGLEEAGGDAFYLDVAVGAVYEGMKLGGQMDGCWLRVTIKSGMPMLPCDSMCPKMP
jgi:hypothetical protein